MKKKILKAFTLVELIIVMAIIVIVSAAMMQMMIPIRSVFVDSSYYEEQRNTQNGMIQYITESTRYATKMGIYNNVSSEEAAVDAFQTFVKAKELETEDPDAYNTYREKLCVITIDNSTDYTVRSKNYRGRILRSKTIVGTSETTNNVTTRVVLGETFYGDNTYSINLTPSTDKKSMTVTVASLHANLLGEESTTDNITASGTKNVLTTGEVFLKNIEISKMFDITGYSGSSTTQNKNTYIVFTLPE